MYVIVFVFEGKLVCFENLIVDYLDEFKDNKSGLKNSKFFNVIVEI